MQRLIILIAIVLTATGCAPSRRAVEIQSAEDRLSELVSRRPKIVIDAGHGGKDLGAVSKTTPPYQEKDLTLDTALMLNTFLQKMGYQTILTRGEDFFIPLDVRAGMANSNQAALFVSVHYNSAPNAQAEGVEVYYYDTEDKKERSEQSKALAGTVLDRIVKSTGCKSRGVKHGNFAVIRETEMPAILVEGGFVSSPNEILKLKNPGYLKTIAGSIALGINDFLKK